ncbi:MgtC/SapB family protein [Croceicoccus sp. F390]|uniref:Protein MgtC n=1 Tax=Croceicoccus esteveae TaxID=3075597 RepID=A0ABU2ZJU9_9SPHN|nr:MgtC/SapB family protein [Croceicoccus sp. F390]MDT0576875.1 MgtC/SapB family protein [Croceicoccus sp. F390]
MHFEVDVLIGYFWQLALAFALALPLGWERGSGRSSVGFRTLPVVAMASCGFALLAIKLPDADAGSLTRLLQGLMGGIGFIGGGAIIKNNGSVKGLVTAASVWNVGAIGVAVAFGIVEIAVVLMMLNLAVLLLLTPVAKIVADNSPDA